MFYIEGSYVIYITIYMKKIITLIFLIAFFTLAVVTPISYAASCPNSKPDHAPDLFQIDMTHTTATVYFAPVKNSVTDYLIMYGYARGQNDFGVTIPSGQYDGVMNYTINSLNPNTEYYFRVIALNGCRYGYWSDSMSARTNWPFKSYYKY